MINPHDLINLPGYGNAEKELRKAGMWRIDPMERLERSLDDAIGAIVIAQDFMQQAEYEFRKAMEATE